MGTGDVAPEFFLFAALAVAVIALCLVLDHRDERADARRRNQAHPKRR